MLDKKTTRKILRDDFQRRNLKNDIRLVYHLYFSFSFVILTEISYNFGYRTEFTQYTSERRSILLATNEFGFCKFDLFGKMRKTML